MTGRAVGSAGDLGQPFAEPAAVARIGGDELQLAFQHGDLLVFLAEFSVDDRRLLGVKRGWFPAVAGRSPLP